MPFLTVVESVNYLLSIISIKMENSCHLGNTLLKLHFVKLLMTLLKCFYDCAGLNWVRIRLDHRPVRSSIMMKKKS